MPRPFDLPFSWRMRTPENGRGLFSDHLLQPDGPLEPLLIPASGNLMVFLILFGCILCLAYLHLNSDRLLSAVFRASFDRNLALQYVRSENSQRSRNLFILQVLAIISIALFAALAWAEMQPSTPPLSGAFLYALGAVSAVIFARTVVLHFLSLVFNAASLLKVHLHDTRIFTDMIGLLLIPITAILYFGPTIPDTWILGAGVSIVAFFYLKGVSRGVTLFLNQRAFPAVYMFYYLCALEILPLFALIRFLQVKH